MLYYHFANGCGQCEHFCHLQPKLSSCVLAVTDPPPDTSVIHDTIRYGDCGDCEQPSEVSMCHQFPCCVTLTTLILSPMVDSGRLGHSFMSLCPEPIVVQ